MALLRPMYLDDLNPVFPLDLNAKDWAHRPFNLIAYSFIALSPL